MSRAVTLSPAGQGLWDAFTIARDAQDGARTAAQREEAATNYIKAAQELYEFIVSLEELQPAPGRVVVSVSSDGTGVALVQDGDEVQEESLEFASKVAKQLVEFLTL